MAKNETPKKSNIWSETKPEVTAVELAHLTASLVAAKLIPTPRAEDENASDQEAKRNHRRLIVAAAEFLETCEDIQIVRREAKEREKLSDRISLNLHQARLKHAPKELTPKEKIPISEILKIAAVERIELTNSELGNLGIRKPWNSLDKSERASAIYLTLSEIASQYGTSTPSATLGERVPFRNITLFGNKKNREKQATEGIESTLLLEPHLFDALGQAKRTRESMIKSQAAKKSRLKRGHDESGRFEKAGTKNNAKG